MNRYIFLISILISLTSCYPIYKTQKPQVTVTVVNEQGVAIPDVKVVLVTAVHPAKIDDQYDEKFTNKLGIVNFEKRAEWKVESLMIHGMQVYDWNVCLAKDGYLTQEFIKIASDSKIKIILLKGNNPSREFPYFC
ncbi:hypothetical protein [Acinetobacter sp. AG3]|jgi:hypothetical protein|uniref:hypothetical protein n=1 Tax=Acinetobacter sp. AG3 TaxID=2912245 RepID=UPI001EEFFEAD|nr:hypothetical protein [Acinetobacter sp. AG3]MCG7220251.1 hypothetical protein [Acinetobacter sp. AG3]